MKNVDLVYFNAGGGHRAAAQALECAIREQGRPWKVRLVNLMEALDPQGVFRRMTGMAPEDLYNKRLARGWTLGLAQELKLLQAGIRLSHAALVRALQQHWASTEPDIVVSLVPNFNRALCESVAVTLPGVPFVTVLTDMADHPPHFWIEPAQDQHLVCGTPHAVRQAQGAGYSDAQISRTSGMIIRPAFYATGAVERDAGRRELGLDPQRPTGVVMFGGEGSMQMASIARALADVQLIVLCGRNQKLVGRLLATPTQARHAVVGFTTEVPRYMRLGDFFIGKPGPGSLSEAVHSGLPVVTFENGWTMPQERYNAQWVRDHGIGVVLPSVRRVRSGAADVIARLDTLRERVRRIDNRAVFEVPPILDRLMNGPGASPWRTPFAALGTPHMESTSTLGAQA
jgi:UDP-N-acetylglucosamine:LPS N-acetylglucosamine transferase